MNDLHGLAILDYYKGERDKTLLLHNQYGEPEEMPIDVFFREPEDYTELEQTAISNCRGSILDIGAGAGAHALLLQSLEIDVTALDNSKACMETMQLSGVNKVCEEDYQNHVGKYDSILMLMNGIGIAGKLSGMEALLTKCKSLLNEGGQIIFDSSDISYLYNDGVEKPKDRYAGEVMYQYEYDGKKGDWFSWLYIDQDSMRQEVEKQGLKLDVIYEDEYDQYLGRVFVG